MNFVGFIVANVISTLVTHKVIEKLRQNADHQRRLERAAKRKREVSGCTP
jgi:hypothetical protein